MKVDRGALAMTHSGNALSGGVGRIQVWQIEAEEQIATMEAENGLRLEVSKDDLRFGRGGLAGWRSIRGQ